MNSISFKKVRDVIACVLLAIFVVSTFSNFYLVNKVGFCAIEIVLIPLLLIYNKFLRKISNIDIVLSLSTIFILWALAYFFLLPNQFATIASTIRSYLIFFLSFFLFYRNKILDDSYELIFYIALFSKVADLVGAVCGLQVAVLLDSNSIISSINILTTPIVIAYSYRKKNIVYFIAVCILCIVASFCSATRGVILYSILNIFACLVLTKMSFLSLLKTIVPIAFLSIAMVFVYFNIENDVKEYSPNLHYRLYKKVLEHDDVVTGDKDREEHFYYLLEHIDEAVIPHGMATRASETVKFQSNRMLWSIRDSSFVEIVYTFGIFSIFIFLYLIRMLIFFLKRRLDNVVNFVLTLSLVNLFFCIPMGYGLLITPPIIFVLGAELGLAAKRREILKLQKR